MIQVKRKEHETAAALLRRFTRKVQQSGVLLDARKRRFFVRASTRGLMREQALRRTRIRKEREQLVKLGKLPESHT